MSNREEVYKAIDSERDYQDEMWPGEGSDSGNRLEVGEQLVLLKTYVDEAMKIWSHEPKDRTACDTEDEDGNFITTPQLPETMDFVRKVAGIAVNCMEKHGAPKRK